MRTTAIHCLGVGHIVAGADWLAHGRHAHAFVEMMVVLGGRLAVRIRKEEVAAGAGDVLFYPPGAEHQEQGTGTAPLDFIFFAYRGGLVDHPYVTHDHSGRIRLLASWLWEEQSSRYAGKAAVMNALLGSLLAETVKASAWHRDPLLESADDFMRQHLAEPLDVATLARHVNMSRAHFIRTYHQRSGRTPMEELRLLRVEAARDLLLTTDLPLKEIAPRVGFCDESHLSRTFRRHLKMPPGYFRKG